MKTEESRAAKASSAHSFVRDAHGLISVELLGGALCFLRAEAQKWCLAGRESHSLPGYQPVGVVPSPMPPPRWCSFRPSPLHVTPQGPRSSHTEMKLLSALFFRGNSMLVSIFVISIPAELGPTAQGGLPAPMQPGVHLFCGPHTMEA